MYTSLLLNIVTVVLVLSLGINKFMNNSTISLLKSCGYSVNPNNVILHGKHKGNMVCAVRLNNNVQYTVFTIYGKAHEPRVVKEKKLNVNNVKLTGSWLTAKML